VLQLINKRDGTPFDEVNLEEAEEFCQCLGDIVAAVYKIEHLISFKSTMTELEKIINKTTEEMESNQHLHRELKKEMNELRKVLNTVLNKKNYYSY
jgi:hypothetical protein